VVRYLLSNDTERNTYLSNIFGEYSWSNIKADFSAAQLASFNYVGNPDLFVIDHSVNDPHPVNPDINSTDMTTYAGAINEYIRLIKRYCPHTQILMVSSYYRWTYKYVNNIPVEATTTTGDIVDEQEKISDNWQIEFVDMTKRLQLTSSIKMTTSGYWDANRIWHDDGFEWSDDGSTYTTNMYINGYFTNRSLSVVKDFFNPRIDQLTGKWVYDTYPRFMYMWDGLHPHNNGTRDLLNLYASQLFLFINSISIGY
jgi:lysophospholipase L1-like esterase